MTPQTKKRGRYFSGFLTMTFLLSALSPSALAQKAVSAFGRL